MHEALSPAARSVAGRWSSPRASATFHRCRLGPRGFPLRAALPSPKLRNVGPHGLDLSFRALLVRLEPLATPDESVVSSSSSLGLARLRLFAVRPFARPLPEAPESPFRITGTTRRHPVPSSWFLTTSTAFSARRLRVCCTPLPALRFAAFPAVDPRRTRRAPTVGLVSRDAVRTLRRVPLVNSRTASLRPFPSYR